MMKSSRRWGLALLVALLTMIGGTVVALTMSDSNVLASPPQSAHTIVQEEAQNDNANGTKSISPTSPSAWQVRGNGGGGALVYAAISPHNSQEMVVATDMSAVFHTTDFGQNWQTMPFSQLAGTADADVRFTSDPNVLYAIHWNDYWWGVQIPVRSNDGGQTWNALSAVPLPDEDVVGRLFADPSSTERIVIGYETGAYFSGDGGATYQLVATGDGSNPLRLAGTYWEGDTIYVALSEGIYLSTDGGSSFAPQNITGLPPDEALVNVAASREGGQLRFIATVMPKESILPAMEAGAPGVTPTVYRLDWGNGGWQQLSLSGEAPFFVKMVPGNINTIYLAGMTEEGVPGVWKSEGNDTLPSEDGGDSWQLVLNVVGNANVATGWMGDERPIEWLWDGLTYGFDVDPNNPERIVMTSNWIHTSEDGGATWKAVYVKEAELNSAGTPSQPTAYHGTGISPIVGHWIHWADALNIMAGFTDIGGMVTNDGGTTWKNTYDVGLPYNATYTMIDDLNTGRIYAAVSSVHNYGIQPVDDLLDNQDNPGGIYYSDDKGQSWQVWHDFGMPVVWLEIDPNDANTMYVSVPETQGGGIYVTHNLSDGTGATFTLLPAPTRTDKRPNNIHVLNDGTIVASYSFRTINDNENYIMPFGYTETSGVFVSTDGGQMWEERSHANMRFWTSDIVIDPHDPAQNIWYTAVHGHQNFTDQPQVSDTGGLYRTSDRGQTWTRILDNTQAPRVLSVTIHPTNPDIAYVATGANGLLMTSNLTDANPTFTRDESYPFRQPVRIFFNPYNENELWTITNGSGMLMRTLESSESSESFLWAVDATQRVSPDSTPENSNRIWSSTRSEVRLDAVKGENEGFHLVVNGQGSALSALEVVATALNRTEGEGTIPLDKIHLSREAFFEISETNLVYAMPRIGEIGSFPDALIPFVDPYGSGQEIGIPFDVPAGENQPLWVFVEVPSSTPAGVYFGTLTLKQRSDNSTLDEVTLVMEVHPLTLPERASLKVGGDVAPDSYAELHGNATGAQLDTIVHNGLQELVRRRLSPSFGYPIMPTYNNETGFDWSEAEAEWALWLDTHQSAMVNTPFIYNWVEYQITDPEGNPYTEASLTPGSDFDQQARLFYSRLWDDLNERGWVERAYVYQGADDLTEHLSDEPQLDPNGALVYDRIRAWGDIIRHPEPSQPEKGFKFVISGDSLLPTAPYADLRGHIGVWDMYIDDIETRPERYAERLEAFPDEELWAVVNSYTDLIEVPSTYHRSPGLFAWKYGATGILYWNTLAWYGAGGEDNSVSPWNQDDLFSFVGLGAGALFWPGYDIEQRGISIDGPLPSLRLELNGQAYEDYEYLQLLADNGLSELADGLAIAALPTKLWDGLPSDRDRYERARRTTIELLKATDLTTTTINGTVQTIDGEPIPNAVVGNGTFAALTDADGDYTLTIPTGTTTLNAQGASYIPATESLAANSTSADFTLTPVATNVTEIHNSFESEADLWEGDFVTVTLSTEHVTDGSHSMHVTFLENMPEGEQAEINPSNILPSTDWSAFDALEFDVYNAAPWTTGIHVQIYDSANRSSIEILYPDPDTWLHVRIPFANMSNDISDVNYLAILGNSKNKGDRDIYFDHFRLTTITGPDQSAPGAPTDLSATTGQALRAAPNVGGEKGRAVELTWQAPTEDANGSTLTGVQRYQVLRAPQGETPKTVINAYHVTTEPTFRDLEVSPGEAWSYVVRAVDFEGNVGAPSSQVEVTIPLEANGNTYYVAPNGDDNNPGTLSAPWRTIQYAADSVEPGDTVNVRGGVYTETVFINVSGSEDGGEITFQRYNEETPILDGTGFVSNDGDIGFVIEDQSYLIIKGFEIRHYTTVISDAVPMGIFVTGASHHIQLLNNRVHDIETNAGADGNAHGIAVYGTQAPASINSILIQGNELHNLKLGNSEALVLNGNVETFTITQNLVHDSDNIAIDLIGFEGTSPSPDYDQARDGVVSENVVYNIDTLTNPAYGGEQSAAGIYVDGGTDIIIERNRVYDSNFGIEIASEHQGRATSYVTVRNNLIYHNHLAGLAMGGYDTARGSTENCVIVNNTFFENDTNQEGNGELYIQFDTRDNVIQNNIFVANAQSWLITNAFTENENNTVDYNLYFAPAGAAKALWQWQNQFYQGFATYQAGTGNDSHSQFINPQFVDEAVPDLHLEESSPAIDMGQNLVEVGETDIDGETRIQNGVVDVGADEYSTAPSPTPSATASSTPTATGTASSTPTATPTGSSSTPTATPTATNRPIVVVQVTIDPSSGGTLSSPDEMVQLNFPAAAVSETTVMTYTEQMTPSQGTGSYIDAGTSFDISARDANGNPVTKFEQPFTMRVTYQDADWEDAEIENESYLNIYWWDGKTWLGLLPCTGCQHDTAGNQFTIVLNHLTEFALLGDDEPPSQRIYLPLINSNTP